MKTVLLLGELGKKFGKRLRLDVRTPAEAVRALCANFPEFQKHMTESENRNVAYRVTVGKSDIGLDELHDPAGKQTIKIVPVVMGAGGGLTKIIIGALIIGAAFYTGGASIAASGFMAGGITTTFWGGIAVGIGTSLILGGAAQMLSPTLKATEPSERPENDPSYVFNGAVNTTAQGQPVPIGYGRMVVGSAVVSAGITTEEIPVNYVPPTGVDAIIYRFVSNAVGGL